METKFNFKSQVCTDRNQSERLLALGLKKETADMRWERISEKYAYYPSTKTPYASSDIPAWSLHRLLCMLTGVIPLNEAFPSFNKYAFLQLTATSVSYEYEDYDGDTRIVASFYGNGFFAAVVDAIEWLIKEGYFNKEYLV